MKRLNSIACVLCASALIGESLATNQLAARAGARLGPLDMASSGTGGAPVLPARIIRTNAPPRPVRAVTNIVLSWAAYTDAWFCVQASTNLTDWYFKTNVPICRTEVTVAAAQPAEFFRIKTCVNVWSNVP